MTELTQADYTDAALIIFSHFHPYQKWEQLGSKEKARCLCAARDVLESVRVPDACAASGKPMPQTYDEFDAINGFIPESVPQTMDAPERTAQPVSVGCAATRESADSGASFDCGELDLQHMKIFEEALNYISYQKVSASMAKMIAKTALNDVRDKRQGNQYRAQPAITDEMAYKAAKTYLAFNGCDLDDEKLYWPYEKQLEIDQFRKALEAAWGQESNKIT